MNPDERPSPLRNTFQADVAALLADARLLRTYAVERGKLPDDGFHGEFVQTSNQLAEYAAGPQAPDPATLAALEKKFLVLYNKLAAAVAPVTAESIRRSQAARGRRFFWPTVLTVSASILVFFAVVLLQGYWVMGKRLRDQIQRQDATRQELVVKNFTMDDTMAQLSERMTAIAKCEAVDDTSTQRRKRAGIDPEQVRKCAVRTTLEEELSKTRFGQMPVARELKNLQEQVQPATSVLTDWFTYIAWFSGGSAWDASFRAAVAAIDKDLEQKRSASEAADEAWRKELAKTVNAAARDRTLVAELLKARSELVRAESEAPGKRAELEQRRWRVLSHRIDIALDVVQSYALPALLGLLGALVFVLRDIAVRLRSSTYIPDSASNGVVRIVVGAMAGVLGGWFIPASDSVAKSIPPLVIPFLFGYSVDILFGLLDKAVTAMSSRDAGSAARPP